MEHASPQYLMISSKSFVVIFWQKNTISIETLVLTFLLNGFKDLWWFLTNIFTFSGLAFIRSMVCWSSFNRTFDSQCLQRSHSQLQILYLHWGKNFQTGCKRAYNIKRHLAKQFSNVCNFTGYWAQLIVLYGSREGSRAFLPKAQKSLTAFGRNLDTFWKLDSFWKKPRQRLEETLVARLGFHSTRVLTGEDSYHHWLLISLDCFHFRISSLSLVSQTTWKIPLVIFWSKGYFSPTSKFNPLCWAVSLLVCLFASSLHKVNLNEIL